MSNGRRVMCWGTVLWLTEGEYEWAMRASAETNAGLRDATPEEIEDHDLALEENRRQTAEDLKRIAGYFKFN